MAMPKLNGVIVAVMTPFCEDGAVNFEALEQHLNYLIGNGVHGVMVTGTAGEFANLTDRERMEIAGQAVKTVAGRVPVIVHTGHMIRESMLTLTRHAEKVGADAVMVVAPPIVKPTQREMEAYFKEVASAVSIGVVIYDNPGRIAANVGVDTLLRVSEVPNIIGLKDSGRNLPAIAELIHKLEGRMTVLSGEGDLFLPSLALGAEGGILTVCNFAPRMHVDLYDAFMSGDLPKARLLNAKLLALAKMLGTEGKYHAAIKAGIRLVGIPMGPPRLPLTDVSPELQAQIREQLVALGLVGKE